MILKLAYRNILAKPLGSALAWVLLSTGVGLISLLILLERQLEKQFDDHIRQADMVIGAKGSPLQLILSAVYHIDAPTGNIPYGEAKKWMTHPYVESAIPLAYGDSYQGYSILGTTPAYLDHYRIKTASGKMFQKNYEVVAGNKLAKQLNLTIGDQLYSTHGNEEHGEKHTDKAYTVTGILTPSGNVIDNLLVGNMESVWDIHDHADESGPDQLPHHHAPAEAEKNSGAAEDNTKMITAVLVKFRDPMGYIQLPGIINDQTNLMAALPSVEINRLLALFDTAIGTLKNIGWGIMAVSALSVFTALFNSLKDRKKELALMRTLGAGRLQLLQLLLLEGLLLCLAGLVTGAVSGRIGLWLIVSHAGTSYAFSAASWIPQWPNEGWLVLATVLLGIAAAVVPATRAYCINISKTLAHA